MGFATITDSSRASERGSLFTALFGAVITVGLLTAGMNVVLRGPVSSMSDVTRRAIVEGNVSAAARLAIGAAAGAQANSGDCDSDGYIEPVPYSDTGTGPRPVGGGYLPDSFGATQIDPWSTQYGYCVWDHGSVTVTNNVAACGGLTAKRLKGAPSSAYATIAIISAGKDRVFQTSCNAYADTNADGKPDTPLVNKPTGSDDIILSYTYSEASTMDNLWNLKSGSPTVAEIGAKDIEIKGRSGTDTARIGYDAGLGIAGVADFKAMKADRLYPKTSNGSVAFNDVMRFPSVEDLPAPVVNVPAAADCTLPTGGTLADGDSVTLYSATSHANCSTISQVRTCSNGTLSGSASYQYASCATIAAPGQIAYTTPGTYTWTAPAGVTSVSVVSVGGGGSRSSGNNCGGGGGGLGYKNNISVVPGQNYTVVVGAGYDSPGCSTNGCGRKGEDSYFSSSTTVAGKGGGGGCGSNAGGTFVGDGGGNGGNSYGTYGSGAATVSAGAGGYSGNGGSVTCDSCNGNSGAGGGGGGGIYGGANQGGGVGLLGLGSNGAAGQGGSGGAVPNYGGGGGGNGAVRIIWPGNARSFPSTRTANE
ncbi:MAG: hypothetical protein DI626_09190 [Micavibrio aeruginosavorus]|uniref:Glycine-rich domain-containing protein n=1 Tax=Micavibrio aeruginosavorus TaxID=349221 RepID=A0A2W4ZPN9_9BACT|nr:MAG: hypothetical protein DI626_09190 [Micavibrio aeruginosavorus]